MIQTILLIKLVALASKSLSPAQANYSNIERETLALVFGVTRFHTYLPS